MWGSIGSGAAAANARAGQGAPPSAPGRLTGRPVSPMRLPAPATARRRKRGGAADYSVTLNRRASQAWIHALASGAMVVAAR
jgi:hypothetical protein